MEINIEKMAQNVTEKAIQELRDNGVFVSTWIKCSDNYLPDMDVDVLGTSKYGDVLKVTRMKSYLEDAGWNWVLSDDIEGNSYHPNEIIAWMPLPERYEPQESEDVCEKCLYAEETDGNHCYECVKGESKFKSESKE